MDDTLSREAILESLTARGHVVRPVAAGRYELTSVPQASVDAEAIPPGASVTTLELDSADWSDFISAFRSPQEGHAFADEVAHELETSVRPIARMGVNREDGFVAWFTERVPQEPRTSFPGPGWYAY